MTPTPAPTPNEQPPSRSAKRTGLARLGPALHHSLAGLRAGWSEPAFRQETWLAVVMIPLAFWLGRNWLETAVLASVVLGVLITELLNSGLESAIDRIGLEHHPLSARAKDLGSAAVLLSLLLAGGVWLAALCQRFF